MQFKERYNRLNDEQKQAVDTIYGPVLVLAGPGSGKTELLGMRVANILKTTDAAPNQILCLTFTESAALNMRKRLESLIGSDAYKVAIHTFHSFGAWVIARYPEHFFGGFDFKPADEMVKMQMIEAIFEGLNHDNPLSSFHPDHGHTYLSDALSSISHIRRAGFSPNELEESLHAVLPIAHKVNAILEPFFSNRMSKAAIEGSQTLITELGSLADSTGYVEHVVTQLSLAILEAQECGKATPLSAFKTKWMKRNTSGKLVMKDIERIQKLLALAEIYREYTSQLRQSGYFDFDDMILEVLEAIRNQTDLRLNLQEQFQYILTDEFQDTSGAQLGILEALTDGIDQPNILAVGDDDQAIFSFQGAEVQNILRFVKQYHGTKTIVLQKNYRSTAHILNVASALIEENTSRITKLLPDISKVLEPMKESESAVDLTIYDSEEEEYAGVAASIAQKIDQGTKPKEIAVIAKNHKHLESMAAALNRLQIPVQYERASNVFDHPVVHACTVFLEYLHALSTKQMQDADLYLSQFLALPHTKITASEYWRISIQAYKEKQDWLTALIQVLPDSPVIDCIQNAYKASKTSNIDSITDAIIGEGAGSIKAFYFDKERVSTSEYHDALSNLQTFIGAIRECNQGNRIDLSDTIDFIRFYMNGHARLLNATMLRQSSNAISLYTAHKSKGLEFPHVYVLHANTKVWFGRGYNDKIPFPSHMPLKPAHDQEESLRLLFVAITRAEHHLHFSTYNYTSSGKEVHVLPYLQSIEPISGKADVPDITEQNKDIFPADESAILSPLLERYSLSVTHLSNFLRTDDGGPMLFLERNLLRFPQGRNANGVFGTIVHAQLNRMYSAESIVPLEETLKQVEDAISRGRFTTIELPVFLDRGKKLFTQYQSWYEKQFHMHSIQEKKCHTVIGTAAINGAIDRMLINEEQKTITVIDFKTGKSMYDWHKGSQQDKLKLYTYRLQLLFYKVLIESLPEFEGYSVTKGIIEFVQADKNENVITLEAQLSAEDANWMKHLIESVFKAIQAMDWHMPPDLKEGAEGVEQFANHLIETYE